MRFTFGYKFSNFFFISNLSSKKSLLFQYFFAKFHPPKRTEPRPTSEGPSLLIRLYRDVSLMRV